MDILYIYYPSIQNYNENNDDINQSTENNENDENDENNKNMYSIIYKYNNFKQITELTNNCPICLELINENENKNIEMPCGHQFHANCINNWYKKSKTCPVCRKKYNHENTLSINNFNDIEKIYNYNCINSFKITQNFIYICDVCNDKIKSVMYIDINKKELCKKCYEESVITEQQNVNNNEILTTTNLDINKNLVMPNNLDELYLNDIDCICFNIKSAFAHINNAEIKNIIIDTKKLYLDDILFSDTKIINCEILSICNILFNNENNLEKILIDNQNIKQLNFDNKNINADNYENNYENKYKNKYENNIQFTIANKIIMSNIFENLTDISIINDKLYYCQFNVNFNNVFTIKICNIMFPLFPKINKNVKIIYCKKICSKITDVLSLEDFNELTLLYLDKCRINNILLPNNNKLTSIIIKACKLKNINLFTKSISDIVLSVNNLTILPELEHLTELCYLNASHNKLTTIPKLPHKNKFCSINLSHNLLKEINLFESKKYMKTLDLSFNYLKEINFKNITAQYIIINNNKLSYLKHNLQCEILQCNNNKIKKILLSQCCLNINCNNNLLHEVYIECYNKIIDNIFQFKNNPLKKIIFTNVKTSYVMLTNLNIKNTQLEQIIFEQKTCNELLYEKHINVLPKCIYETNDDTNEMNNNTNEMNNNTNESKTNNNTNEMDNNTNGTNNDTNESETDNNTNETDNNTNDTNDDTNDSDDDIYTTDDSSIESDDDIYTTDDSSIESDDSSIESDDSSIESDDNTYISNNNLINNTNETIQKNKTLPILYINELKYNKKNTSIMLENKFIIRDNNSAMIFSSDEIIKYSNIN